VCICVCVFIYVVYTRAYTRLSNNIAKRTNISDSVDETIQDKKCTRHYLAARCLKLIEYGSFVTDGNVSWQACVLRTISFFTRISARFNAFKRPRKTQFVSSWFFLGEIAEGNIKRAVKSFVISLFRIKIYHRTCIKYKLRITGIKIQNLVQISFKIRNNYITWAWVTPELWIGTIKLISQSRY